MKNCIPTLLYLNGKIKIFQKVKFMLMNGFYCRMINFFIIIIFRFGY